MVAPSTPVGWSSEAGTKQPSLASASITDSIGSSRWSAISTGCGERPELVGQLALGGVDPGLELLDPARRPDHPAVVAEVLAQLAADGRHRVGQEVVPRGDVVAAGGLGQRQGGHLAQVVERDAARAVARGLGVREVEVERDHGVAEALRLLGGVRGHRQGEQLAGAGGAVLGGCAALWALRGAGFESFRGLGIRGHWLTDLGCVSLKENSWSRAPFGFSTQASGRWLQLDTHHPLGGASPHHSVDPSRPPHPKGWAPGPAW